MISKKKKEKLNNTFKNNTEKWNELKKQNVNGKHYFEKR